MVKTYYGDTRVNVRDEKGFSGHLTRLHSMFAQEAQTSIDLARRIIISSPDTFTKRHGPAKLEQLRQERLRRAEEDRLMNDEDDER